MTNLLPSSLGTTIKRTASIGRGIRGRSNSDVGESVFSKPWSEDTIPRDATADLRDQIAVVHYNSEHGITAPSSEDGNASGRAPLAVQTKSSTASTTSPTSPTSTTPTITITDAFSRVKGSDAQSSETTSETALEKAETATPGWEDGPTY